MRSAITRWCYPKHSPNALSLLSMSRWERRSELQVQGSSGRVGETPGVLPVRHQHGGDSG